jgi:serine/threonine protein kinase
MVAFEPLRELEPCIPTQAGSGIERWVRLSVLLDELLELGAEGRAEKLAQLALDDEKLAEQAAALLAQQSLIERRNFLAGSVLGGIDAPLAGQRIGAYTLQRRLGVGGMSTVWFARRSDGRYEGQVAVKLLDLALLAHHGAERFVREGSVLARLSHPNIARLLDAGVTAGGQPYLVLEHVDGQPIDRWCDARSLGVQARVRLVLDVLAAVAHAHGKGILHRDIKPSNILVTDDGQVKLLDFGIAKLLDSEAQPGDETELTQASGRLFTPDFAAPEQVEGTDVTRATDVYALGVLLYLLLGGGHPTARHTQTPVERLRSIVETEPLRLSEAVARAHRGIDTRSGQTRTLRGDLDTIVGNALKKVATERYASAAELADDLRRYLADEPLAARPDSLGYRAAKFIRRRRRAGHGVAMTFVALPLVALLSGILGARWQALDAGPWRDAGSASGTPCRIGNGPSDCGCGLSMPAARRLIGTATSRGSGAVTGAAEPRCKALRPQYLMKPPFEPPPVAGRYDSLMAEERECGCQWSPAATAAWEPFEEPCWHCRGAPELLREDGDDRPTGCRGFAIMPARGGSQVDGHGESVPARPRA